MLPIRQHPRTSIAATPTPTVASAVPKITLAGYEPASGEREGQARTPSLGGLTWM